MGSAAVVAIGAGSLADMFEVHERGQKVGHKSSTIFHLLDGGGGCCLLLLRCLT